MKVFKGAAAVAVFWLVIAGLFTLPSTVIATIILTVAVITTSIGIYMIFAGD